MTVCQVCQKENPAGAEYCEDCGAALSAPAPTPVGAGASGGGSTAASAPGASPSVSAAGSPASPAPGSPTASADTSASSAPSAVPTVPPTSSSSAAAASPTAPAAAPAADLGAQPKAPTVSASAQARLLAVRYGAPTGDEIPLIGQRLVVGRFDPETGPVDIDLSESAESGHISRQHGELYREGDGSWMVRDLGSTNGVFVKGGDAASFGPRITAPRPLQDGDEVAFGNARFIFKTA